MKFPARHFHAAQRDGVLLRLQAHVVGDVHRRNDEAQLLRQILPQRFHPGQQLAALILIDQRHQPVAHFEAEFVELQQIFDRILGRLFFPGCRRCSRGCRRLFGELGRAPGQKPSARRQQKEGKLGQSRNRGQRQHHARGDDQGTAPRQHLPPHIDGERGIGRGAGDHDAPGHRDQQRRNHGHQAVAHGEHGVGLQRFAEGNVELKDADQKSGDDIDGGNQDGRDGVALVEAGRAVHGAVEFGVVGNLFPAGAGLHSH